MKEFRWDIIMISLALIAMLFFVILLGNEAYRLHEESTYCTEQFGEETCDYYSCMGLFEKAYACKELERLEKEECKNDYGEV